LGLLVVLLAAAALALGPARASRLIVTQIRAPRAASALLCGAALAVSGLLAQCLLSNPLASPTLLGVNSGAGLLIALCGVWFPAGVALRPVFAFGGALLASLLIYALSARVGSRRGTILLAGVAVSSLLSAGIDALHHVFPQALPGYQSFLLGGFAQAAWQTLSPAAWLILAALACALLLGGELDVFALGDETAQSLGQNVPRVRIAALLLSSILAGAAVSVCGLLSFVGLLAPHIARKLFPGSNARRLVLVCALLGAALVALCDLLARTLFAPYELPAGILLSFLGSPFLLWLLLKRRAGHA
jgi:iron complex transport system permease protein